MAITRLYDRTNAVDDVASAEVNAELDQIVTELNLKLDSSTDTISGNVTVSGDLSVGTLIKGSRQFLKWSFINYADTDVPFLPVNSQVAIAELTDEIGFLMLRPGSIVGYSLYSRCTTFVSNKSYVISLLKNGSAFSPAINFASVSHTGLGFTSTYGTIARGTNTFNEGDVIGATLDVTGANATSIYSSILVEIQVNT